VGELGEAWEDHAAAWIAWARKPGHDGYWQFHRDLFLELVPPPSGRTLDLGCGEGRLGRDLAELGHTVVGEDVSPTMIKAARKAAPELEFHVADAAALPFEDESFALVVAFMSLQDVDDLAGTVGEAARVLASGGRLCLAIVHPLSSAGHFAARERAAPFVIESSYPEPFAYSDTVVRDGLEMTFVSMHRPLAAYIDALTESGLLVELMREIVLPEHSFTDDESARWTRIPLFLHVRALKPAG
jgi:SAM-dependent methyltransferase